MANTIKLKNSGTSTNVPSSLEYGEIAINYADGKLFYKDSNASIVHINNISVSDDAPSSPQEGDMWFESDTTDFHIYYDGVWVDVGGSSVANISVGSNPPSSDLVNGDLWFDSDTAKTYIYYNDATSSQWIEIGAVSAAASGSDGYIQFATGGTFDSSANLVWDDANTELEVTGVISATGGVVTLTSAGAPSASLADGAIAVDTSNDTFYYRSNSSWKEVSGTTITSSTTDAALLIMEIGA